MLTILCLLLPFSGLADVVFGQECGITLEPAHPVITITKGSSTSILCKTNCSSNQIVWFDRHNERVPPIGSVFSVSYNRGKFVRLILANASLRDIGRYDCVQLTGGQTVREVNINVIDTEVHVVEFFEEEERPRRGDVRVDVPFLPNRRPVRDVQNRALIQRVQREAETNLPIPTESITNKPETTGMESKPTTLNQMSIDNMSTARDGSDEDVSTKETIDPHYRPDSMTTGSGLGENENTTFAVSPSGTSLETSVISTILSPAEKNQPVTSGNDSDPPKGKVTLESTAGSVTTSTTMEPNTEETNTGKYRTTVKHGAEARTVFGRYGLLAFALALSAAFLLLYTLILLNVILPRCCWKKRSVSFRDEGAIKHKETGPNAVDFVALKPLDVEAGSNIPDHGFTTVDLDDKPDDRPDDNKRDDKQNGAPVSPSSSSEPQSPSKYVTTFTIGRKPSTTDPSGVFIHEGKAGESVAALPEEGTEVGQTDAQTSGERSVSASAKKETENDLDTSKEGNTSTDSNTDSSDS